MKITCLCLYCTVKGKKIPWYTRHVSMFFSLRQIPVNGVTERTQDHGWHLRWHCKDASQTTFHFSYKFTISIFVEFQQILKAPWFCYILILEKYSPGRGAQTYYWFPEHHSSLHISLPGLSHQGYNGENTDTAGWSRDAAKVGQEEVCIYWGPTIGSSHLASH